VTQSEVKASGASRIASFTSTAGSDEVNALEGRGSLREEWSSFTGRLREGSRNTGKSSNDMPGVHKPAMHYTSF